MYTNDPVFELKTDDVLPKCHSDTVIYTEEGYILVRYHPMERWRLNPVLRNAIGYYSEIIVTGYSRDGQPLWQTVSDVYVT